jgi:hypothetical protein
MDQLLEGPPGETYSDDLVILTKGTLDDIAGSPNLFSVARGEGVRRRFWMGLGLGWP